MRLQKVERLSFGRFNQFSSERSLPDFCDELNIIFGWNGSGKTTLSKVFQVIEKGDRIANCSFRFNAGTFEITENTDLTSFTKQIRVFNNVYIEEILRGSSTFPYIFFAGKEAVDFAQDEQKLREKQQELIKITIPVEKDDIAKNTATLLRTVTGINSFKKELVGRSTYASYDKTDFEIRVNDIKNKVTQGSIKSASDLLRTDIDDLKNQLVNNERLANIDGEVAAVARWVIEEADQLKELLASQPIRIESPRIESLDEKQRTWVKEGVDLHFNKNDTKKHCLFCNSDIKNQQELASHFSEEIVKTINRIDEHLKKIESFTSSFSKIISPTKLQKQNIEHLRTVLDAFTFQLREKRNNVSHVKNMQEVDVAKLEAMTTVTAIDGASIAYLIETHFVAEQYDTYFAAIEKFNEANDFKKTAEREIAELDSKVRILKQKVKNTHEAARALNRLFKTVFSYRNIEISDAENGKGYALRRNGVECSFSSLSEGEKNFIALAYFVYSLNDSQNTLPEDGIVVIDDPVSSMDKQSIFQIFSVIVNEIKQHQGRQYFILTHSLDFFGHLKEQFGKKIISGKCRIFSVTSDRDSSYITAIHPLLKDHRSDYYYVFSVLNKLKKTCDLKDAYLAINLLRRWLETFLEFKFSYTGDFQSVLENAFSEAARITKDWKDNAFNASPLEMYRFINHGSHGFSDPQSMDDSILENASRHIEDAFKLVKILDPLHYKKLETTEVGESITI